MYITIFGGFCGWKITMIENCALDLGIAIIPEIEMEKQVPDVVIVSFDIACNKLMKRLKGLSSNPPKIVILWGDRDNIAGIDRFPADIIMRTPDNFSQAVELLKKIRPA